MVHTSRDLSFLVVVVVVVGGGGGVSYCDKFFITASTILVYGTE